MIDRHELSTDANRMAFVDLIGTIQKTIVVAVKEIYEDNKAKSNVKDINA